MMAAATDSAWRLLRSCAHARKSAGLNHAPQCTSTMIGMPRARGANRAYPFPVILPRPARILWADVCRDGGSHEREFVDGEDRSWHLRLPVKLKRRLWWWSTERRAGYFPPILREPRKEDAAGLELDWDAAVSLHGSLRSLIDDRIQMGGAARAGEMLSRLARRGRL